MPVTHLVNVILRPGVQSIQVQYKYPPAEVWTNYNEGQRIPGGVDVKFAVETYTNFTLTEWSAYYSDEYDDTVNIQLTGVQGESAWTFTLPSSDVYIRCEATSDGSPGYDTGVLNGRLWVMSRSFNDLFNYTETEPALRLHTSPSIRQELLAGFKQAYPEYSSITLDTVFDTGNIAPLLGYYNDSDRIDIGINILSSSVGDTIPTPLPTRSTRFALTQINYSGYGTEDVTVDSVIGHARDYRNMTNYTIRGMSKEGGRSIYINWLDVSSAVTGASIRYIMSPDNSGEVDSSAPSEFGQGTTEFTFKWRIRAAYEFKRLTPFAVGEGSLEEGISYSLDSYDGDTRTYTFTVTKIPDWAIGVRVLIETIMIGDPNDAGGTNASDTSVGGDGTYDDSSDEVPLPAIPSGISAADSGLVTLFRPSIAQVKDFGNYLWSNITDFIENLQKIFTSPMDYVIGFNIFPVTPAVGASRDIYIGNWLTNIQMPPVLNQFYEFNAGVIQVREYYGSFLDYYPNTRARIMLPFIGDREININEIMGKTLHLWYRIDLLSGACVAILNINDDVYYQWNGNCAVAVPVTGSDWSRLYSGIARAGLIVGSSLAFGAAGGVTASITTQTLSGAEQAAAVSAVSDSFANLPKGVPGVAAMRRGLAESLENINEPRKTTIETHNSRAIQASTMVRSVGYNVMSGSTRAQHTGDMTGAITIMGNRTPYLVLEYPNVNLPENYKHIFGYPSNQYAVLGNLSGYTKCKEVMFESTTATDDEIGMVISALKGGVYL